MRRFLPFSAILGGATTVGAHEKMSAEDRSQLVAGFVDKMTTDLRTKNPDLAQGIRNWISVKQPAKDLPEGNERLLVELVTIEGQAKDGRVELSRIQLESVIVYIVKPEILAGANVEVKRPARDP